MPLRRPAAHAFGPFLRFIDDGLRLVLREERLLRVRDQVTAVVLDELHTSGPAGRERRGAVLALVELHGLDVRGDLALGDHPDHGASAWPSRLERLQRPGRRGDE